MPCLTLTLWIDPEIALTSLYYTAGHNMLPMLLQILLKLHMIITVISRYDLETPLPHINIVLHVYMLCDHDLFLVMKYSKTNDMLLLKFAASSFGIDIYQM